MGRYQRAKEEVPSIEGEVPTLDNIGAQSVDRKRCFADSFKVLVIGIVIFCAAISVGLVVDIYYLRRPSKSNAVVTSAPECSTVATNILKRKGNAVDAAVAAMMCLSVVTPDQCSLASSGYMLVHDKRKQMVLDFQFTAPRTLRNGSENSDEVAIPGLLMGLRDAHQKFGKLPLEDLISPAIELASKGFTVSNATALHLKSLPEDVQKHFFVNKKLAQGGDTLKMDVLSNTLTSLIEGKYSLAEDMIEALSTRNESITLKDFKEYKTLWKKTLVKDYQGHKVITTNLPSSGVLLLSALAVLNELPKVNESVSYLQMAEVLKLVLPNYMLLQDPDFDETQRNRTSELLSDEKAKELASKILSAIKSNSQVSKEDNDEHIEDMSTASATIMDTSGMAVSIISSLGGIFGSKLITKSGVIMNNGLSLFSKDRKVNQVESLKRPFSFTSPAFLLRHHTLSVLTPSVDRQGLASLIQVLKNMIFDGLDESQSLDKPRLFYDGSSGTLDIEGVRFTSYGFDDVVTLLKSYFKKVVVSDSLGNVNAVSQGKHTVAISDPR